MQYYYVQEPVLEDPQAETSFYVDPAYYYYDDQWSAYSYGAWGWGNSAGLPHEPWYDPRIEQELSQTDFQSTVIPHVQETHEIASPPSPAFACKICSKSYTHQSALRTHHAAAHAGERPFVCEICNKAFTQVGFMHGFESLILADRDRFG